MNLACSWWQDPGQASPPGYPPLGNTLRGTRGADRKGAGPGDASRFRSGPRKWYKGGVEQLRVSVSGGDSYTVVALAGESDVYTYDQLRGALQDEAAKGVPLLVIDLSGLEFMDSTGVQVLLDIRVMMNDRGGKLALAAPQNTVARVLNLVGADQLIPVYGTVEEAAGSPLG